jgi:hypothetical protein
MRLYTSYTASNYDKEDTAMANHPLNLALRFGLELAMLAAAGVWGWQQRGDWLRFVLAIGVPLIAAALWGTFRAPNDPGSAPVAVPGALRLALELVLFVFATWALYDVGYTRLGASFGVIVLIHYAISYDRIVWLVRQS